MLQQGTQPAVARQRHIPDRRHTSATRTVRGGGRLTHPRLTLATWQAGYRRCLLGLTALRLAYSSNGNGISPSILPTHLIHHHHRHHSRQSDQELRIPSPTHPDSCAAPTLAIMATQTPAVVMDKYVNSTPLDAPHGIAGAARPHFHQGVWSSRHRPPP